jgi:hypothetical protein
VRGGVIQCGIPAPPRHHGHVVFGAGQDQRHHGEAASDDHDRPVPWQPAAHVFHQLPHSIHAGLMPALAALLGGLNHSA